MKGYGATCGANMLGKSVSIAVNVDCMYPFIGALSMIASSPDWIMQINDVNMYSRRFRKFRFLRSGSLIAYDAGTDDGRELIQLISPGDSSLDMPTVPQKNVRRLLSMRQIGIEDALSRGI